MKMLENVFINSAENRLKLVDIYFNERIADVKVKTELDWRDVNSVEKKNAFIKQFQASIKESDNYTSEKHNGNFMLAIPGAIDSHVHFDTPGFEFREDFEHASMAAAFGGVTTVVDMPCTSLPPVTNCENLIAKKNALMGRSFIDYAFYGGVGGNCFTDYEKNIKELAEQGVAGIKVYVISGMKEFTDLTYDQIRDVACSCKSNNLQLAIHAEDREQVMLKELSFKNENRNSWRDYAEARNSNAEITAVKKIINIAEQTGCKILIVHISCAESVQLIYEAQKKNIKIFAETCPHYLYFTQDDFNDENIRNYLKTTPPVKFDNDREKLWEYLISNRILFVNTDHAGCIPEEEKSSDNFWYVYGGIPGVEHRVPFLLSEGFLKNKLSLEQTINLLSKNQAEFFNIQHKGKIAMTYDADIAIINLWKPENIKSENMHCKGKYTPFEGVVFNAVVEKTFLRGNFIMEKEKGYILANKYGRFIKIG